MKRPAVERGVTLIELLIVIAVLGFVLAGVYGLLNYSYQTYLNIRRRSESQQTARTIMDYLVYRLREIEGARTTNVPWNCTDCHKPNMSFLAPIYDNVTARIPCRQDVMIPRQSLALLNLSTIPLPQIAEVPALYQNMSGNYIKFRADLLPIFGLPDSFTDGDGDGVWEWTDDNGNTRYDPGEAELLEDMNENSQYDSFSETWTLQVRPSSDGGPYYELVESVNFTSLQPRTKSTSYSKLLYNKSQYPDTGYEDEVVAYGLVGLSIKKIPKVSDPTGLPAQKVESICGGGCHGSNAATIGAPDIYNNLDDFSYTKFMSTHPWWNIKALTVEVATSSSTVGEEHFVKFKQYVIPRNLEINKYSKSD